MLQIHYSELERLHAAARRERAREIACILVRAFVWIRTKLTGASPHEVCCADA